MNRTLVTLLALVVAGCGGGGDGGAVSGTDDTSTVDVGGEEDTSGGDEPMADATAGDDDAVVDADAATDAGPVLPPEPIACEPMVSGKLRTATHLVPFDPIPAGVTVTHDGGSGCVNGVTLALSFADPGPCELSLDLVSAGGDWFPSDGELVIAGSCGWPPDWSGNWTLDPAQSAVGLAEAPMLDAEEVFDGTCVDGATLGLVGRAVFVNGPSELELRLDGLELTGGIPSEPATAACPAAVDVCPGQTCDEDGYGVVCGTCGDGEQCFQGGCIEAPCPPKGPYGTTEGAIASDVGLLDCDGDAVSMHQLCGEDASYVYVLAPFSPTSSQFVTKANELHEELEAEGLTSWVVLTADLTGGPPDAEFCSQYADLKGLTMRTLFDPSGAMAVFGGDGTSLVLNEEARIVFKLDSAPIGEVEDALDAELGAVLGECSNPGACP